MDKEFYDKYGKEFKCPNCSCLSLCLKKEEPQCVSGFIQFQTDKIADLEAKLAESEKNFIVANNLRKNSNEVLLNYKTEKYGLDKTIQELRKIKLSFPEKEWYYKGFENCERQMSSHIADLTLEVKELKQQIAESEKTIKYLKGIKRYDIGEMLTENVKLKQQLADTTADAQARYESWQEEIRECDRLRVVLAEVRKQLAEKEEEIAKLKELNLDIPIKQMQFHHNQDKISFAVEQLEKVKEFCIKDMTICEDYFAIEKLLDNQIKQLKEGE